MHIARSLAVVVLLLLTFLLPCGPVLAQQAPAKAAETGQKPEAKAEQKPPKAEAKAEAKSEAKAEKKREVPDAERVPVFVEAVGEDVLGQRLVFELREALRTSAGFRLAKAGDKALRMRVAAVPEFKERPQIGSAYAVTWLFSEGGNVLSYYLESGLGLVDETRLKGEAQSLAARTDELAGRFAYLFAE